MLLCFHYCQESISTVEWAICRVILYVFMKNWHCRSSCPSELLDTCHYLSPTRPLKSQFLGFVLRMHCQLILLKFVEDATYDISVLLNKYHHFNAEMCQMITVWSLILFNPGFVEFHLHTNKPCCIPHCICLKTCWIWFEQCQSKVVYKAFLFIYCFSFLRPIRSFLTLSTNFLISNDSTLLLPLCSL